jgi:hypothetical protein
VRPSGHSERVSPRQHQIGWTVRVSGGFSERHGRLVGAGSDAVELASRVRSGQLQAGAMSPLFCMVRVVQGVCGVEERTDDSP